MEIFQQLGGRIPDYVFVPTGDGVILSGVYRGFEDLVSLGLAEKIPCCVAVQAEGSAAISRALDGGSFGAPVPSSTLADSIAVDVPRGGLFALGRLQRHGGKAVTVSDRDILAAQHRLSSRSGLFAEPAAAAAWAGFEKMKNAMDPDSTVVVLITGNGLKDIDAARSGLEGA